MDTTISLIFMSNLIKMNKDPNKSFFTLKMLEYTKTKPRKHLVSQNGSALCLKLL